MHFSASAPNASPFDAFVERGFAQRTLPTPVGRMSLHEAGTGDPIVFLHGIGGGASSWTWIDVAPELTQTHRVIVPDWIGWGLSEHPARFVLFEDYVAALRALLDDLNTSAVVVAQSLAAGFALALAERQPGCISRIVLQSPTGGKDFGEDVFPPVARAILYPLTASTLTGLPVYRALFHRRGFIESWLRRQGFFNADAVTPEIIDAFLYCACKPNAAWSALPFVNGRLRYDLEPYLARSVLDTTFVCGAEDTTVGVDRMRRLAAVRGDGAVHFIENTKACPELEKPHAVVDILRRVLADRPGE